LIEPDEVAQESAVEGFATSLAHVLAELEQVDLALRLLVYRARQLREVDDRFAGLCISEQEIDEICAQPADKGFWRVLDDLSESIAARRAASISSGVSLRLARLINLFRLDRFDVRALLVCVAPEIDLRYERLFAYLQDDVQKRWPTVDLVLNLLCPTLTTKLQARTHFAPSAPLLDHRLVELFDDPACPHTPLLGKLLRIDTRIAGFLLGSDDIDPAIAPYSRLIGARTGGNACPEGRDALAWSNAVAQHAGSGPLLIHVQGPDRQGRRQWAASTVAKGGASLLVVEGHRLPADSEASFDALAQRAVRESHLRGAALYWEGLDSLLTEDHRRHREALIRAATRYDIHTYFAGTMAWEATEGTDDVSLLRVQLPLPSAQERGRVWRAALCDVLSVEIDAEVPALAAKFRLTAEDIHGTVRDARDRALIRGSAATEPRDLYAACRARSSRRLDELAKKIQPRYVWRDLVLPADALLQLHEFCEQLRLRPRVFEEWGFEQKFSLGKGLHALFAGPSGTGKTMAAEIMAHELGLDLYKIDLSSVVSKYIGETEKNLARIFNEAEATSAILFFDEADAIFGKRSDVKDAHDRYANVETSFLLQRIEEYSGITILATNLRRNIDEAFLRRLSIVVQFALPEQAERLLIWQSVFPAATPRAKDVDLEFMAQQFKLSGGNIKNIALAAAFLAASNGGHVSMAHILRATRREFQKMGKTHVNAEFGVYAGIVEA
jgi:hypothetical protein